MDIYLRSARAHAPGPVRTLAVGVALALLVTIAPFGARAQDLAERVTTATLDNGLRILLVERPAAPVISFELAFDVGGIDEPGGLGGIAHMVEHMAFKGTRTLGPEDAEAEATALAEIEVLALALRHARREGDAARVARLQEAFDAARQRARALARDDVLDQVLSVNGAVGLNASTGYDVTRYVVSLPANRLELYARIYADVMANTVFRSFYAERDVVREERRQRSEDDPQGVLFEAFLAEAFPEHPYGRPLIGAPEEIAGYTATKAKAFYQSYYAPDRAVLVLVGDVDPERDLPVLRRYFGEVPQRETLRTWLPEPDRPEEPRRVTVRFDAQPQVAVGYPKPTYPARDAYVLDLIDALMSQGRTSRLYQRMVLGDQSALSVTTSSAFPGIRDENMFLFYGQPRAPHGPDELVSALQEELDRLAQEGVSERELQKVKNQVRADSVRALRDNARLASQLASHEHFAGGWERLFEDLDVYASITAEEIQEVAARTFVPEHRTIGVLRPPETQDEEGSQ
ncbi:MAG: pitrilysin family protein [Trueperaceae bacterium]|nr:pitrilysin family protein [Trueperaceae bacterium]